jgi:hypothetical protein
MVAEWGTSTSDAGRKTQHRLYFGFSTCLYLDQILFYFSYLFYSYLDLHDKTWFKPNGISDIPPLSAAPYLPP